MLSRLRLYGYMCTYFHANKFFFFFKCHNSGLGKMPRDCFGEGKWPIVVTLEAVSSVGGEMFY